MGDRETRRDLQDVRFDISVTVAAAVAVVAIELSVACRCCSSHTSHFHKLARGHCTTQQRHKNYAIPPAPGHVLLAVIPTAAIPTAATTKIKCGGSSQSRSAQRQRNIARLTNCYGQQSSRQRLAASIGRAKTKQRC